MTPGTRGRRAATVVALLAAVVVGPGVAGAQDASDDTSYAATIRRDNVGVPHVTADSYGSLGFGIGWAFAEDNICTLMDFTVTVNAQRSKYFGPDETWRFHGNGTTNTNRESDFFYAAVNASGVIEAELAKPPPHGPHPEIIEAVRGYVAGVNGWLASVGGADGISDPRCQGAEWVGPLEEMDAFRRFWQLASLASTGVAIDFIGGAQPPSADTVASLIGQSAAASAEDDTALLAAQTALLEHIPTRFGEALGIGSNAYGLGSEATANGKGMVLGNPHFPWHDGERLYQLHLTIPGVLDVAGAGLYGVPLALIGHTAGVAWSHTVSTAYRFTPFELTLVPGDPTSYLVDGVPTPMDATEVTIEMPDGSLESRTLYSTQYGPVVTGIVGLPLFPWTPAKAWAMGDANNHMRYLNHFFEVDHAQSVRELFEIQTRNQGIPWVNTIAADSTGEAYYADISVVPNVPDDKAAVCNTPLGVAAYAALRLPVLDASRSDCGWDTDPDAVVPGIFGPDNLPHLFRDDYVTNGNDSYWLSNPHEPLTGFARIIGDEETERTLRTRIGLIMVEERLAGTDEYDGTKFTQEQLRQATLNNRQYAAELVRDDLVGLCESLPGGQALGSSGPVNVSDACPVLAAWDLRDDLDSPGAVLFRRFWVNLRGFDPGQGLVSPGDLANAFGVPPGPLPSTDIPWLTPFDASDAVHTPNTLNVLDPRVQAALADAIADLEGAGIPLDGALRDWQYEMRGDERIPIHGGPGSLGVFNAINASWSSSEGYSDVPHGSSFIMVVNFVDGDCPVDANAIVTYSQSEDVTNPHFADMTRMFSNKEWNDMPFCEDEVAEAAESVQDVGAVRAAPGAETPGTGGGVGGAIAGIIALVALAARRR
ncbi:MAG: penicillin acylase family protein [Nitriliruptorales bacterium]|nr:penicillin acylase family protein [Nitriliruptorales bacterium]